MSNKNLANKIVLPVGNRKKSVLETGTKFGFTGANWTKQAVALKKTDGRLLFSGKLTGLTRV